MTVRELAAQLGLSKTTVADALRNKPHVNPATAHLVLQAAKKLGYQNNPVASAFLQQIRSKGAIRYKANLALLVPYLRLGVQQKSLVEGAKARALELGYGLETINYMDYTAKQLTKLLVARGVLGVLIGPIVHAPGHLTLEWERFAGVAYGYSMVRPALHRLVHNRWYGVRSAVRECRKRRKSRVALILAAESDRVANGLWSAGYWGIQRALKPAQRMKALLLKEEEYKPDRILEWVRKQKPDAVIFHNTERIPPLPEFIDPARRITCPVVLDRLPNDTIAGIDQCIRLGGERVVDLLSLQILHNERGIPKRPNIVMLDGIWVDENKVAPTD